MKLIHYGAKKYDPEKFKPIKNRWEKPTGGLWASPVECEYSWKDWCEDEQFRNCDESNSFTFTLSDNARIFVIDTYNDFMKMPFFEGVMKFPDFEKVALEFDAIHLTTRGMMETRFTPFETPDLYGWDCESVLVLNRDVIVVEIELAKP